MSLITKKAPNFITQAVSKNNKIIENFNFKKKIKNKNCILFFWPMDFTFICPSEILAFNYKYKEFKKRNTILIGSSIDSVYTHLAWKNTSIENGGIGNIKFNIISDITRKIQNLYKVEYNNSFSLRATFLIDKNRIIRHISINDLPLGRNIDEILRLIDALNFYCEKKKLCPAQWNLNKKGINPTKEGLKKYFKYNLKDLY